METLQKTFRNSYVSVLKEELKSGVSAVKYSEDRFDFDESQVRFVANVYHPEGLLEKMLSTKTDFEAAVLLYEAYKDVSPLLASNETFWVYLCHTELFPYCQKRWPLVKEENVTPNYILDHWFFGSNGMMRNTLASLWWSVYFSVDETAEDPYELTEVLFRDHNFRVVWFAIFLRIKNGLLGMLRFIKDNYDLFDGKFRNRARYLAMYFNRLGATRQLSYLSKEFFYEECERIRENIELIDSEADLKEMLGQS